MIHNRRPNGEPVRLPVALLFLLSHSPLALSQAPQALLSEAPAVSVPTQAVPSSYTDLGAASATMAPGRVMLFLNRSPEQQSQLDALIREQSDPTSPNFRKFLTPVEIGQQFGPSDASLAALSQWLTDQGFVITRILKGRLAIEFSATTPQLEAAFQTSIHAFSSPASPDKLVYANASSPRIPAAFGPLVKSISLSNIGPRPLNRPLGTFLLHPPSDPQTPLRATPSDGSVKPLFNIPGRQPCAPTGVCYALVPGDYATIYDTKPLLAQGVDGAGVTIGIPSTSNIDLPTVQRFRTLFLPKYSATNLPNVILDGPDPGQGNGGTYEAYIDVETAGGVAPNATINLYTAADSAYTNGLTLALTRAVEDNAISILSVSYGECEAYLGSYNSQFRDIYEQAAAQGITVVVSAGDSGSAGCDPPPGTSVIGSYQAKNGLAVSGLASTPYNIAVGGTDFLYPASVTSATLNQYWDTASATSPNNNSDWSSALSYIPEKPWDDSDTILNQQSLDQFGAGGGGQSSCAFNDGAYPLSKCKSGYPKPFWQQGFGNDSVRDLPDVSLFAAIGGNYSFSAICVSFSSDAGFGSPNCAIPNGGPDSISAPIVIAGFGGTSVSSPLFAGMLALVSEKTQTARLGLATPTLYPLSRQFPSAFHDIATGTNAMACVSGTPNCGSDGNLTSYSAATGFDLATGLGSVDANLLASEWSSVSITTLATTTTLTITPTSAAHDTSLTFTINVTAGSTSPASGTVALLSGTTLTVQTTNECAAFPCTFQFKGLPGGSYPVVARFLADGQYASSTSAPVNVTITPEASALFIVNPFNNDQISPPNGLNGQTNVQLGESVGFLAIPVPASTPVSTPYASLTAPPATGTLTILDSGTAIGSPITLAADGSYFFNSSSFALGPHSLVVQYSGDASYLPSSTLQPVATPLNFTVIKAVSSILIQGLGSVAVGYPLPLNLYLNGVYSVNGRTLADPSGTLLLTVNGTALPPAPITPTTFGESQASITIPGNLIVLGTNNIVVSYPGDANYSPISTSATAAGIVFQTYADVGAIPSTTSAGLPLTFYLEVGRVALGPEPPIPTNVSVTLLDGTTPFATVPLVTDTSRISADAQFPYSGLSVGTHTITMQYAGDSGDLPSSGTATVIIKPGIPNFTLSTTPLIFAAGATAPSGTSTLTVSPINGFTGVVTLTCSAATIPGGKCSIPSTTTITGSSAATLNVTISTNDHIASLVSHHPLIPPSVITAAGCFLFALAVPFARRRSRIAKSLTFLATAILLANICACGSTSVPISIPSGTFIVTIQATSGTLSNATSVTVTIQ